MYNMYVCMYAAWSLLLVSLSYGGGSRGRFECNFLRSLSLDGTIFCTVNLSVSAFSSVIKFHDFIYLVKSIARNNLVAIYFLFS
ncbi:cyclin-dependent kinase C-2 [Iris pallida]|uniref:Cyclin-dependent kinase C-2 n=1 Tax=Iris pallida TaxID=29817 RepID=A0AAX6FYF9_IRIPA|nr:cyclin-dependent kinase C-2 [Iris pallida]